MNKTKQTSKTNNEEIKEKKTKYMGQVAAAVVRQKRIVFPHYGRLFVDAPPKITGPAQILARVRLCARRKKAREREKKQCELVSWMDGWFVGQNDECNQDEQMQMKLRCWPPICGAAHQ